MVRYTVVVMGDLGHSPRLTNQALSLAKESEEGEVTLVGYQESPIPTEILERENIQLHILPSPPSLGPGLWKGWYLLYAPFKALFMFLVLLTSLFRTPRADYLLVQNPPAIPTLAVIQFISLLRGSSIIIDWHNFGYSILALKFGIRHPIVKLAHLYEWVFGRSAFAHITVTRAMAEELQMVWKVQGKVVVLHDRAPAHFRRLDLEEAHETLQELERTIDSFLTLRTRFIPEGREGHSNSQWTLLTRRHPKTGKIEYRPDRPYLLVSSTSWTPDEDFGILLEALQQYNDLAPSSPSPASLAIVITGKGPDKAEFERRLAEIAPSLSHIAVALAWLPLDLYPKLLGLADLGISLHASSSNLDLPMKVVDMLGAGLPTCALDFPCMGELITHHHNGLLFATPSELTTHLQTLFLTSPSSSHTLTELRHGASEFRTVNWQSHWESIMRPLFTP